MPTFELGKSIEARKLNKRSKLPTNDAPVTIPYAAIINDPEYDRDLARFAYLGELYQCARSALKDALRSPEPAEALSSPAPAVAAESSRPASQKAQLQWEPLTSSHDPVMRAKVPGGWLVSISHGESRGLTFYPDPEHRWDGRSLP